MSRHHALSPTLVTSPSYHPCHHLTLTTNTTLNPQPPNPIYKHMQTHTLTHTPLKDLEKRERESSRERENSDREREKKAPEGNPLPPLCLIHTYIFQAHTHEHTVAHTHTVTTPPWPNGPFELPQELFSKPPPHPIKTHLYRPSRSQQNPTQAASRLDTIKVTMQSLIGSELRKG